MTTRRLNVYVGFHGDKHFVGCAEVEYSEDPVERARKVSTALHQVAWDLEESTPNNPERESGVSAPKFRPRKVWNKLGDFFYEVAPGLFVQGMSYEDAVETYKVFGGTSSLEMLSAAYPDGLRVDYV